MAAEPTFHDQYTEAGPVRIKRIDGSSEVRAAYDRESFFAVLGKGQERLRSKEANRPGVSLDEALKHYQREELEKLATAVPPADR